MIADVTSVKQVYLAMWTRGSGGGGLGGEVSILL